MSAPSLDALVASPYFRWVAGMFDTDGGVCVEVTSDGHPSLWYFDAEGLGYGDLIDDGDLPSDEVRPDIDHPGNHGHLLALVRKAWGPDVAIMDTDSIRVRSLTISDARGNVLFRRSGVPRGERLAAALLAAPVKAGEP